VDPLRRHLPHLLGLHAAADPPRGADAVAGDLRLHPRLDLPGRRRPDPPGGRAARRPARHPQRHGHPAGRRRGDRRRLEDRRRPPPRSCRLRSHPPEPADPRRDGR